MRQRSLISIENSEIICTTITTPLDYPANAGQLPHMVYFLQLLIPLLRQ